MALVASAVMALGVSAASAGIMHQYVCQITGTSPGSASECHSGGSGTPLGAVSSPFGVTISGGDLWATSPGTSAIDEFDSAGAFVSQISGSPSSGAYNFGGFASGVARSDASGDVFVADSGPDNVKVFDNTGAFVTTWNGSSTPSGSFGGGYVAAAVDNSTGGSSGDVYVLDSSHQVIDKLSGGTTAGSQPTRVAFSGSASYISGSQLTGTPSGAFAFNSNSRDALAVDSSGNLYVADNGDGVVDEFSSSGTFVQSFTSAGTPTESFSSIVGVGVDDATGDVYVVDSGNSAVDQFSSSGAFISQITGVATPAGSFSPQGVAVDASGDAYVTDGQNNVIDKFGPAVLLPDVTTGQATNVLPTSATLNGTVTPDGTTITDCRFDYGTTTSYGQTVPCVPASPSGASPVTVTAALSGLRAGITYHFRLVASNANGTNTGSDATLSTPPPPSIDSASATNLTPSSADLTANINPNGFDTTYHFEYGTSTSYGTSVPIPDADIGSGSSDVPVSHQLTGLRQNTEYHWRVVAANANGTSTSGDHTFSYLTSPVGPDTCPNARYRAGPSADLPDCRAYEMVSPLYTQGFPVAFAGISPDGSFVHAVSFGNFAGGGGQNQSTAGNVYDFTRTISGWQTTPLDPSPSIFSESEFDAVAESGAAILEGHPDGTSDFGNNYYLRASGGSLTEIGPELPAYAVPPTPTGDRVDCVVCFSFVAASADLSHVLFSVADPGAAGNLPPGVTHVYWPGDGTVPGESDPSLYEYSGTGNSAPQLVGVDSSGHQISQCGTSLGSDPSDEDINNAISSDGSTVFFTALAACSGGSGPPANELFARANGGQTVAISEPSTADCSSCNTRSPANAVFLGASPDGSKVLFSTSQALLPGDGDATPDLYEYDFDAPPGHRVIQISAGGAGDAAAGSGAQLQGVTATSQDLSRIYFVAQGVLTSTPNSQGASAQPAADNLYLYERNAEHPAGATVFIATLSPSDSSQWSTRANSQMQSTPDGQFLAFTSSAELTHDDTSTARQVFRYDAQTNVLARVSIGEHGFNDNGNSDTASEFVRGASTFGNGVVSDVPSHPAISDDGSVVFASTDGLTPQAINDPSGAIFNAYEYENGHVYLISDGRDTGGGTFATAGSYPYAISPSGADIFLESHDDLVPPYTAPLTNYAIFDAKVDGGFAPGSTSGCFGDTCQATPSAAPLPVVGTLSFSGPADVTPPGASTAAKVRVTKKTVTGATFVLRVKVPGKGRIFATGSDLKSASKSTAKAGTFALRLTLTRRAKTALKRKGKLRVLVRLRYVPRAGKPSTAIVSIIVIGRARA